MATLDDKAGLEIVEGHPLDGLVDDAEQAARVRRRADELLRADDALKQLRIADGVAQKDLADALGISAPAVAQLEARDLDVVQLGTIRRYFAALGYDVELHVTAR